MVRIFTGWALSARSAPAISVQRVTRRPSMIYFRLKTWPAMRGILSDKRRGPLMGNSFKQTNVNMKSKTVTGPGTPGNLNKKTINSFRKNVLEWYDENRRRLPWRALPGYTPDPYHVWLSEIMLQQTVVAAVVPYFLKFVQRWPRVHDLAAASNNDVMEAWAGLGYYARARNLHKCAKGVSAEYLGVFPSDQHELKKLPGIGDYTSAAITAIAFNKPASVVDGNVERVLARW